MKYNLNDFDFFVPQELIAQKPLEQRDHSRLIIRYPDGKIEHSFFYNLVHLVSSDTLLVLNDSKVIPCRTFGNLNPELKDKPFEIFLMEEVSALYESYGSNDSSSLWKVLANPFKKIKLHSKIYFYDDLVAQVIEVNKQDNYAILKFNRSYTSILNWLNNYGFVPLPPYIKRINYKPFMHSEDKDTYQTVFAKHEGSSAAPTAGLHFTQKLLEQLKAKGIDIAYVTLHVGGGTFLPVKTQNIEQYKMHSEKYFVSKDNLNKIINAKIKKKKIINVGTTTLRCLEALSITSNYDLNSMYQYADQWLSTDIFIRPTEQNPIYTPFLFDALITNFHQPKSTLFMLISALFGLDNMKKLYQIAINEKYRFFSYGDACLLWKKNAF